MNAVIRSWLPDFRPLLGITLALFVITGIIYPLLVTVIAQGVFPRQANGSILEVDEVAVGSSLVGQQFSSPIYFHGRPSAAGDGYDASASSGSNLGPTNADLLGSIEERVLVFREMNGLGPGVPVPADAVTASASGLDPHVSPATARLQAARVAESRGVDEQDVRALVEESVEEPLFRVLGEPRVNVLKLNIALDERFPVEQ